MVRRKPEILHTRGAAMHSWYLKKKAMQANGISCKDIALNHPDVLICMVEKKSKEPKLTVAEFKLHTLALQLMQSIKIKYFFSMFKFRLSWSQQQLELGIENQVDR